MTRRKTAAPAPAAVWFSAPCAAAVRPRDRVPEGHALCRAQGTTRCGCACHHRRAVSLGLVIGGPSPLTGPAADTPPPPDPEPDPYPEDPQDLEDAEERSHREVTAAWAEKGMRDAGFEPLEPYSGNLS
ncbi:hypothetical protein RKE29_27470, partial [Streptomyces sp. B1866]|uniref:hypothetical protein n=1 Tax=Streptomyces sp. B1866 TaxID=3075431 RepID=UPI00288DF69F